MASGLVRETGRRQAQPAPDPGAAGRDREAPLRRAVRRRPPRRGEGPGQGAGVLASATSSASGTRRTSGPSCGTSTTPGIRQGEHIRVFPLSNWTELDIWHYIARERHRAARRSTSRTSARCSSATACCCAVNEFLPPGATTRSCSTAHGALPHGRRHDLHRRGRSDADTVDEGDRRRSPRPGSPSAARPGPTTGSARPRWKTASGRATSDTHSHPPRWTCCGSPPPAPSTTASPP